MRTLYVVLLGLCFLVIGLLLGALWSPSWQTRAENNKWVKSWQATATANGWKYVPVWDNAHRVTSMGLL